MRPFDLQAALRGEPVCTKVKEKAIIKDIEFGKSYPLVVEVETNRDEDGRKCKPYSQIRHFTFDGKYENEDLYFLNLAMKDDLLDLTKFDNIKPFDRIIGKLNNCEKYWCVDFYSNRVVIDTDNKTKKNVYLGIPGISQWSNNYTEIHHYEKWMEKYIGTTIPFDEWEKGENE